MVNVVALVVLPFTGYYVYHRRRNRLSLREVATRAGFQPGASPYFGYCVLASLAAAVILTIWPPPLEPFVQEGSAQHPFKGLGIGALSVTMALMYGVIQTGFSEEFFFRGLVAGSLSRRLPTGWANIAQSAIFLVPHLLILFVMPEMWSLLPIIFGGALFGGWIRIKSESFFGPWVLHATVNVMMALGIAARSTQ